MGEGAEAHASPNLPKAQAIKDATMAYFINRNWQKGETVIHYNGSYHSDRHMGIIWYLKKYSPQVRITTISTVLQDEVNKMNNDNKGASDFVVVIPVSMTRTYKSAGQ